MTAPSPIWEGEHSNWTQFLISGSNALNGSERCDCWHGSGANASKTTENRYFHARAATGQAVNVTFIGYWASARGHVPLGWAAHTQLNASTYGWSEFDWQGDLIDVANVLLAAFGRVDAVVLNTGWWKVLVNSVPRALAQLSALESIVKDKRGLIWATTTPALIPSKANAPRDGLLGAPYAAAQKLGWRVLDRHGLIERLRAHLSEVELPLEFGWADSLHFRPYVYEASNQLLLSMLCEDAKQSS